MRAGNRYPRTDEANLPYFSPVASDDRTHKLKVKVWDPYVNSAVIVRFGNRDYQDYTQHKDEYRRLNYLSRSGGIHDKAGNLTKDDSLSPNFWARRVLWASGEPYTVFVPPGYKV
jgi:hypothetical protein